MKRLRELDFLRGIAILLVLLRHQSSFPMIGLMAWVGVDLFFVLSGFLVSGLLFREYLKFGNIQPKIFLIRRGFKIYPVYYLFTALYVVQRIINHNLNLKLLLADLLFLQNYVNTWGHAFTASWSLAVEEHFYFLLVLVLWLGLTYKKLTLKNLTDHRTGIGPFEKGIFFIMTLCLLMRFYSNITFPEQMDTRFTLTHLRIDSLLAGVFVSYLYHFRFNYLTHYFQSNKYLLCILAFTCISWTPFVNVVSSSFARTIGFSLVYIAFAIVLMYILLTDDINEKLNRWFSARAVNCVSKIGYCSYSIYVIHTFVFIRLPKFLDRRDLHFSEYAVFFLSAALSILIGIVMTYTIERWFLNIRDRYYPRRRAEIIPEHEKEGIRSQSI